MHMWNVYEDRPIVAHKRLKNNKETLFYRSHEIGIE